MFLGNVVNLFIGLALTFGTMGLAVSTITEGIASFMKLRANTLLAGLKDILNDNDNLTGLAGAVLMHGGVNPQAPNTLKPAAITRHTTPPYIQPQDFALAMIDILQAKDPNLSLSAGIAKLDDAQLTPLFKGMLDRATTAGVTDIKAFRNSLANWFNNAMDQVSGDYKRKTQWISLLIGLALAVLMNVDSLAIARALWSDPQLTMSLTSAGSPAPTDAATSIINLNAAGFPFGWGQECTLPAPNAGAPMPPDPCAGPQGGNGLPVPNVWSLLVKVLGWALTATAALFGAPFWFDLLQRFIQLRGTGTPPDEKLVVTHAE
jgi:hypothetical protein